MIKKLFIATLAIFTSGIVASAQNDPNVEIVTIEGQQYQIRKGEAPQFTLEDKEGKEVSLSDFRGKWVVLDFWGSWCRWCIAGIPEMKKAYDEYHSKGLEIIGIDCGDPKDVWISAVEKYELPWVNVYNPDDNKSLLAEYYVKAFPTKILVDPQGVIHKVVIGEDPEFYELLKTIFDK